VYGIFDGAEDRFDALRSIDNQLKSVLGLYLPIKSKYIVSSQMVE
jgi:hypothetical protein